MGKGDSEIERDAKRYFYFQPESDEQSCELW